MSMAIPADMSPRDNNEINLASPNRPAASQQQGKLLLHFRYRSQKENGVRRLVAGVLVRGLLIVGARALLHGHHLTAMPGQLRVELW